MSKPLRIAIGLIISVICLWFVFRKFDFDTLKQSISNAAFVWFLPAATIFCANMLIRSFRWRALLSPLKEMSIRMVLPQLLIGFFMNNILPARGGEVVRAVALSKSSGLPTSSILGSIVAERLADMLGLLMVLLIASKLLPWNTLPVLPIVGVIALGSIVVGVVIKVGKNKPEGLIKRITSGFLALQSPRKISMVVLCSLMIWLGEMLIAFFVSRAMHFDLTIFESAGLLTGLSVGVMIPAAPGYVGTYELFGKTALSLLGKPEMLSLGFVLVLHFFQLVVMALLALPCLILPQPVLHEA